MTLTCRAWHIGGLRGGRRRAQCLGMVNSAVLASVAPDHPAHFTDEVGASSGRLPGPVQGLPREHSESDLRCYQSWCAERVLDPLAARRPHLEL
jgi:hypothetical protein